MWCQNVLAITHATQRHPPKYRFILVMIPKGGQAFFWVTRCDKTISENRSFLLALQPVLIPFTSKKFAKKVWESDFLPKFVSKANSSAKIIAAMMCNACWPCQHPLAATEPCDQPTRAVSLQAVQGAGCSARSVESFVKLDRALTASTMWTP